MSVNCACVSTLFTTLNGNVVRIAVTFDADGGERITLTGINCDLTGDAPGTYMLVGPDEL